MNTHKRTRLIFARRLEMALCLVGMAVIITGVSQLSRLVLQANNILTDRISKIARRMITV